MLHSPRTERMTEKLAVTSRLLKNSSELRQFWSAATCRRFDCCCNAKNLRYLSTDQSGDKSPHSESYDFNPVREFFSSLLVL
jgi:hypothetical protein